MTPAPLTYIQSLREKYFATKEAYKTAAGEELEALPRKHAAVCRSLVSALPETPEDAVAFLDVAIADFRQFEMDDGKTPLSKLDMGKRLVFAAMLHAQRALRAAMREGRKHG